MKAFSCFPSRGVLARQEEQNALPGIRRRLKSRRARRLSEPAQGRRERDPQAGPRAEILHHQRRGGPGPAAADAQGHQGDSGAVPVRGRRRGSARLHAGAHAADGQSDLYRFRATGTTTRTACSCWAMRKRRRGDGAAPMDCPFQYMISIPSCTATATCPSVTADRDAVPQRGVRRDARLIRVRQFTLADAHHLPARPDCG